LKENRRLQSTPNSEIASLQEELTLVKMRDAEAQVSMNELRQRIADLNREWQLHDGTCMKNNPNNDAYDLIAHELITLKMREAQTDCDNKLLSQKIMDIETQKQVSHNQIKRQDDEIQRLRLELDEYRVRENELRLQLHEMKNQMNDRELRQKEDSMMLRIREAECTQTNGDLRQKIAELEVKNQELITRGQIMDDRDLQDKLVELQDELEYEYLKRSYSLPIRHQSLSCLTK
jgi:chromosome segregation ATPase